MTLSLSPQQQLKAFINAAQYLAGLTSGQDIWQEAGKFLVRFFGADVAAFGERRGDGGIGIGHRASSERGRDAWLPEAEMIAGMGDVFESGFLTFLSSPAAEPVAAGFFPILHENRVIAVMLVGHLSADPLAKEHLDLYLAAAGLIGATYSRRISETAVLKAKEELEQRVVERTAELNAMNEDLAATNEELAATVSERKRADEQIKASLSEKEVMLKEIHHRVKNNLQVISSLISLQANGSKDEAVRQVLRDVTYRVRSMALVHEKLYQSANLAHIDFAEYTRSLLSYLWRAHGAIAAAVRMTFDLEPVSLPTDTAVTCGLILNELAVNALEHAFQGRSDGEMTVSLHNGSDGRIRLCVADNGIGLPMGFDWRQTRSLGLRLVQMLSKQLDSTMEVSSGDGTKFEIVFGGPDSSPS